MAAKGGLGTAAKSSPVARGAANTFSTTDYAASPGRLSVETQPAGAAVVVDGTRRGLSPISVTGLTAGDHEVLIRTRHGELRQRVRLAAGESVSVVVPLAAVPTSAPPPVASRPTDASLVVRAPIELRIFEGDQLLGTSAMERTPLTPGAHRLVLRNDEVGFELARTVTVTAGKTLPLSIDVPRQQVAVNAAPWADVWADGRHVGQTPIGNLPLSPGPHALVFRHPQLGEKSLRLLVRANEPGRVSVDMRK